MAITPGYSGSSTITGDVVTQDSPVNANSKYGTKKILITPTLVNVNGTNLVGRKSLNIQNNSLTGIYIGNDNLVDRSTGIYLASGSSMTLSIDPSINVDIYAISIGIPALVSILEV